MIVDFPLPEWPTKANLPDYALKDKSSKTIFSLYGYLNETFLNYMLPANCSETVPPFYRLNSSSSFDYKISKIPAPATFDLAISGINWVFCPTPIAAKITEKTAVKTALDD